MPFEFNNFGIGRCGKHQVMRNNINRAIGPAW